MIPLEQLQFEERRTVRRWTVDCEAWLRLVGGVFRGRLTDLSEKGARFACETLPIVGARAMINFSDQEHFGKIVWASDGQCGLLFERPIPASVVQACSIETEIELGPVARFGNIPLGQKRSRRLSLVSDEGSSPAQSDDHMWEP